MRVAPESSSVFWPAGSPYSQMTVLNGPRSSEQRGLRDAIGRSLSPATAAAWLTGANGLAQSWSREDAPKQLPGVLVSCSNSSVAAVTRPRQAFEKATEARRRRRRGRRWPTRARRGAQQRPTAERLLHEAVAQLRGAQHDEQQQEQLGGAEGTAEGERREDQERPVPEVDRVGDVAQVLDRPGRGDAVDDGRSGRRAERGTCPRSAAGRRSRGRACRP